MEQNRIFILISIFITFFSSYTYSQNSEKIDSLIEQLESLPQDTKEHIDLLNQLSSKAQSNNKLQALNFALESLKSAQKINIRRERLMHSMKLVSII